MAIATLPDQIQDEEQLDSLLSEPYPALVEMLRRLRGDIMILGVGGKMGPTLAWLARRAADAAGTPRRVIGVSRFTDGYLKDWLTQRNVEALPCDLLDPVQVARLPQAQLVIFMAGRKFGERGSEYKTWMHNAVLPAWVGEHLRGAATPPRVVAFSTGCVYPLIAPGAPASTEKDAPAPVGEYASSCLARERIFEAYADQHGVAALFFRLNYAVEMRYGVLVDIALDILNSRPVNLAADRVNVIWQGDANNRALLCLEQAAVPPVVLNVTGPETLQVQHIAATIGELFAKKVRFTGAPGPAYLSDASRSLELFGPPRVPVDLIMRWTVQWLKSGGKVHGKPTHFSVNDGQFLD